MSRIGCTALGSFRHNLRRGVRPVENVEKLLSLLDFLVDDILWKHPLGPFGMEFQPFHKRSLHFQNLERSFPPLAGKTKDDLLDPRDTQRLAQVGVTNDLLLKVKFAGRDLVRVFRRLDNQANLIEIRPVLGKSVALKRADCAHDVDVVVAHKSGMIEVVEHCANEQDALSASRKRCRTRRVINGVKDAGAVAEPRDVEHVPEVVIGVPKVARSLQNYAEIIPEVSLVHVGIVSND